MPYCWDGLDNAARITDTGYGADLPRYKWTDIGLASTIERLLADKKMAKRLQLLSRHMQKAKGTDKAADLILKVTEKAA